MSQAGTAVAAEHGVARSPHWPGVEKAVLAANPHCIACAPGQVSGGLQVHHVFPLHYCIALGRPDLELDPRNLVVLCETEEGKPGENHHLLLGHLGDFKEGNLDVRSFAVTYNGQKLDQIRENANYKLAVQNQKLKALNLMSAQEKQALRALMDKTFPLLKAS